MSDPDDSDPDFILPIEPLERGLAGPIHDSRFCGCPAESLQLSAITSKRIGPWWWRWFGIKVGKGCLYSITYHLLSSRGGD